MSKFAAIQMSSGGLVTANLDEAARLIHEAVDKGAEFVVLPENFSIQGKAETDKLAVKEQAGDGLVQAFLSSQAKRHGIWLCGGTVPLASDEDERVYAACLVYDDQGEQIARFDKIHLFDVRLQKEGLIYNESATIKPGNEAVVFDSPFGKIGLAVCYDLRFPELFRAMVDRGAEVVLLPSAFTAQTGQAHWEPLLRARAIENLIYVVAADQAGFHLNGRASHGHSLVVDPWGGIVSQLESSVPGVVVGEINLDCLRSTRKTFPVLEHRRSHFQE